MAQAQLGGIGLTGTKLKHYFSTKIEGNRLIAYHPTGCQQIDFGDIQNCPRQSDVLIAMRAQGIDTKDIYGLQNGGRNKFILYPKKYKTPLLKKEFLEVKGIKAKVGEATPVVREVEAKKTDIFVSGLPLEIHNSELVEKFERKLKTQVEGQKLATIWGFSDVKSGVRIITVLKEEAKNVPTYFYVMGFLVKTWYRGCEKERVCPKCKQVQRTAKMSLPQNLMQTW
jgi:hypothetical protein